MTISFLHHDGMGLNLGSYSRVLRLDDLKALADMLAANPLLLRRDCVNLVEADADFSSITLADLEDLFAHYRKLFAAMEMRLFRRSAWICRSEGARPYVRYWIGDRDTRGTVSTDVRAFADEVEAAAWLMLTNSEAGILRRREGFREIASFPSASARAAG